MQSKCALLCITSFFAVLVAGFILIAVATMPSRNYNVVIDSVSGLDLPHSKDLVLNPEFNLTLRFVSTNPLSRVCMDADAYLQVSYRCTPLAASAVAPHRLCVGPKKSAEAHFVAKGTGVRLPGSLMDSLAADMRSGVEEFDVMLRRSRAEWLSSSCGARRIADGGAWCGEAWDRCAAQPDTTTFDPAIFTPPIFIPPEE